MIWNLWGFFQKNMVQIYLRGVKSRHEWTPTDIGMYTKNDKNVYFLALYAALNQFNVGTVYAANPLPIRCPPALLKKSPGIWRAF